MKTIYMMLVMLLVAMVPAYGQKHDKKSKEEMRKEIRDFKIKYLAQEMDLNEEQKEKFVPLYDKMSEERRELYKNARTLERKVRKTKNASESEYEAAAKAMTEAKDRDVELVKRYDAQFAKFLSAKQIFKMKEAEQEFDRRMRKMRQQRKEVKKQKMEKMAAAPMSK